MTITHDTMEWWQRNMSVSTDKEFVITTDGRDLTSHIDKAEKSFEERYEAWKKHEAEKQGGYETRKHIRRFESGAVRSDDRGRIKPSYISPYALEEIAEHFSNNENDFGATNYFKGIKPIHIIDSVGRHYLDLQKALIEGDSEQLRKDFRSLAANCIMALHQIVLEERGEYKEIYDKVEYVLQSKAIDDENKSNS